MKRLQTLTFIEIKATINTFLFNNLNQSIMKKTVLSVFIILWTFNVNSQPLGFSNINVGLQFGKIEGSNKGHSYTIATDMHYSFIDKWLGGADHKFRIGEYLGFRASFGVPTLSAAFDFGGQAAYGSEKLNFGAKYLYKIDASISEHHLSGKSKYWEINSRIENIYVELLIGKEVVTNKNGLGIRPLYLYDEGKYFGIEFNQYPLNYNTNENNLAKLIYLNYGIMF
jgi:hypothetical protein